MKNILIHQKSVLLVQNLFYPSKMGGPSKTLYDMACKWAEDGYDVTVISSYEYIDDAHIIPNKWMKISGFETVYCTPSIPKINLRSFFKAISKIRTTDTVVFSSFFYVINLPLAVYALYKGKNVIWSPRGETLAMKSTLKKVWVKIIKLLCGKKVVFHATTDVERNNIIQYLPRSSVIVIPNLLNLPKCLTTKREDGKYLLFVGRIAPIKALERVIEALSISTYFIESDYKFYIAGPIEKQFQEYYNSLIQLINELGLGYKICFVGNKSGTDKYQIYHDARCLILPSFSENFGNVVLESLSQGTPVIASKGTPWNSLDTYKAGYHVPNTPQDLASAIDKMISLSDNEYNIMRNEALRLGAKFSTKNMNVWYQYL